ncbi:Hypothetical protein NTJ_01066 [Nesidiocoris tenuis]|uniref:Uncharacterized protein n=1 Tax=Nesidiocoris tenuis TaxID=355587 RepID=A0ABN7ABQ4_9HEMI|nr:Hypothetical protein NTJ_01066 [Nesidiocoris tenuis]
MEEPREMWRSAARLALGVLALGAPAQAQDSHLMPRYRQPVLFTARGSVSGHCSASRLCRVLRTCSTMLSPYRRPAVLSRRTA